MTDRIPYETLRRYHGALAEIATLRAERVILLAAAVFGWAVAIVAAIVMALM